MKDNTQCIKNLQGDNTPCQLRQNWRLGTLFGMDWRDRFKLRFAELKATEGLTQDKLAEMLDVTQGTVGHWLRGRRSPESLEMYEKIAEAIKVHPAWLLYGVDPKEKMSQEATDIAKAWEGLPPREKAMLRAAIHATEEHEEGQVDQQDPPARSA